MGDEIDLDEHHDLRGPAIAITGMVNSLEFHGPFETVDEALTWYRQSVHALMHQTCSIMLLTKPDWRMRDAQAQ